MTKDELTAQNEALKERLEEKSLALVDAKEALETATEKIIELELGLGQCKESYETACACIAEMHAAAVGEVRGPIRSVLGDIEDLRAEKLAIEAQLASFTDWSGHSETLDLEVSAGGELVVASDPHNEPTPEILLLGAKLIREAIFSNGGIAGSQVEGLRALAADLEAAA